MSTSPVAVVVELAGRGEGGVRRDGGGGVLSLRLILWVVGDGVIARESCLVAAPLNEGDGIGSDADSVSPVSLLLV